MNRKMALISSAFVFFFTSFTTSFADSSVHVRHNGYFLVGESGSGEAMIADALIVRPIGLVTTVGGTAVYIVSLPFSLMGGNEKKAREKLVVEPARFTFTRPLGEYDD